MVEEQSRGYGDRVPQAAKSRDTQDVGCIRSSQAGCGGGKSLARRPPALETLWPSWGGECVRSPGGAGGGTDSARANTCMVPSGGLRGFGTDELFVWSSEWTQPGSC